MAIDDTILGLQNTIDKLTDADKRVRTYSEQIFSANKVTGTDWPWSSKVSQGTVRNRKSIIWQINGLPDRFKIPDFVMKINPQNLNSTYTQLINRKRTLGGFIEEHWGEQLDTLSASGRTGGFFGAVGLTNKDRRTTDNFQQFERLIAIYRNNGTLYDEQTGKIMAQGSVVMNYDSSIYNGYFESFAINEVSDKQFDLAYDFSFKVLREVFPGRMKSFKSVTVVPALDVQRNDRVTLDIVNIPTGTDIP